MWFLKDFYFRQSTKGIKAIKVSTDLFKKVKIYKLMKRIRSIENFVPRLEEDVEKRLEYRSPFATKDDFLKISFKIY